MRRGLRYGFADPGWRVWDGGSGFERCAGANGAAGTAECVVSFSESGGGYAGDFAAAGAGVAFAKLLRGFSVRADVVRSRLQAPAESRVVDIRMAAQPKMAVPLARSAAGPGRFEVGTIWRSR